MTEPVDCRFVAARVHQFLDGELDEAEADELRLHMDACEHCLDETDLLAALKRLVHRSCVPPGAPDELRYRIVSRITQLSYTRIEFPRQA